MKTATFFLKKLAFLWGFKVCYLIFIYRTLYNITTSNCFTVMDWSSVR